MNFSSTAHNQSGGSGPLDSVSPAASVTSTSFGGSSCSAAAAAAAGSPSASTNDVSRLILGVEWYPPPTTSEATAVMPSPLVVGDVPQQGNQILSRGFDAGSASSTLPPHLVGRSAVLARDEFDAPSDDDVDDEGCAGGNKSHSGSSGHPTPDATARTGSTRRPTLLPGRCQHADPNCDAVAPLPQVIPPLAMSTTTAPVAPEPSEGSVTSACSAADRDLLLPPLSHTPVKITTTVFRYGKISRAEALERVKAARQRKAAADHAAQAAFTARLSGAMPTTASEPVRAC